MCMNLEAGQVGVVLFGSDRLVREGETVKRTGEIVSISASVELTQSNACSGRCSRRYGAPRPCCRRSWSAH